MSDAEVGNADLRKITIEEAKVLGRQSTEFVRWITTGVIVIFAWPMVVFYGFTLPNLLFVLIVGACLLMNYRSEYCRYLQDYHFCNVCRQFREYQVILEEVMEERDEQEFDSPIRQEQRSCRCCHHVV